MGYYSDRYGAVTSELLDLQTVDQEESGKIAVLEKQVDDLTAQIAEKLAESAKRKDSISALQTQTLELAELRNKIADTPVDELLAALNQELSRGLGKAAEELLGGKSSSKKGSRKGIKHGKSEGSARLLSASDFDNVLKMKSIHMCRYGDSELEGFECDLDALQLVRAYVWFMLCSLEDSDLFDIYDLISENCDCIGWAIQDSDGELVKWTTDRALWHEVYTYGGYTLVVQCFSNVQKVYDIFGMFSDTLFRNAYFIVGG